MSSLSLVDLRQHLNQVPRVSLGLWPTPLHEAPRLARALGGPRLFFKREDLCGLALGGNKIRHLEYILPDALASGADTLVIGERFVSNYGAQMAAATQLVGLRSVIVSGLDAEPVLQGNSLLAHLFDAEVCYANTGDRRVPMTIIDTVLASLRAAGRRPYVIGPANPRAQILATVGATDRAVELLAQAEASGLCIDWIVTSSEAVTQAGLILATRCLDLSTGVLGMTYARPADVARREVARLVEGAAARLDLDLIWDPEEVISEDRYRGPRSHGLTAEGLAAVRLAARTEGVLLDPLYSGKALAGLIDYVRQGRFRAGETVVFVHTGGSPALFSYARELAESTFPE